ncbi:MAG TPA: efflux RND transporter permease subunit [Polyangia bacterium]|jgi:HAE1 family hydrophobic/amphiphilic exporter-1
MGGGTGLFIRRPVMTTLVMLAILMFGVLGYKELPVSDLPSVDFPTILVSAALPGANPDTMASSVATPLEKQFTTIAGISSMTSTSALGLTQITIQFDLARNIDAAGQDVQAAIARAAAQLPPNMPTPPSYQKVNPADQPILFLALTSPTLPLSQVDEYAETFIAQRVSMVSGVAQVAVFGSQKYAVRVQLDPAALATRNLGIDEVSRAVQAANVNLPTGTLQGPQRAYTVEASGQLNDAKAYRPIIVAYRGGTPVRLSELGRVVDSVENDKIASWFNDTRSIILAIQRQPGTNTVGVVDAIRTLLPTFHAQLPASVRMEVLYDRSASIRESVGDVKFTLGLTIGLVILVIFLFLRNARATLIPSLALPFSIVGTFAVLYVLGYSLDNFSLMALTLSVGFVVDDAIVMLENIVRHLEMGKTGMQAAADGAKEIAFTVISMTISLAAVFIPVFLMGGIVGRLLHEFAVTIIAAILVSGVVSLTLTPMMASRFIATPSHERHGRAYRALEALFEGMRRVYERTLRRVIRYPRTVMALLGVVFVATGYLFVVMPKGFLPSEDTGLLFGFTEAAQGISFQGMVEHQQALAAIVMHDPNVLALSSSVGAGGANVSGNAGRIFIRLKPPGQRRLSADEVIQELRPKLAGVPGIRAFLQNLPPIRIGGQLTKALYQLTLQGPDTKELYRAATDLEARMRGLPGLQDVNTDLQNQDPHLEITIDRDQAAAAGVTAQAIEDALYSSFGSRQVSTIYTAINQYQVIVELLPRYQANPQAVELLYIRSSAGQLVPLNAVARLSRTVRPLLVNHSGQLPSVTISFNLRPGTSIGDAVAAVTRLARANVPPTIAASFQGQAQAFQSSFKGLGLLLVLAVVVIYIILGILYESFVHPLTILSGLPAAGFGALLTLLIFREELSLYAFVGIIMLIGIVKKNAIMMIDFALEAERTEHKSARDAIVEGCLIRFRPIMMTTMAALVGTLPIAIGFGAGAASRRPLGLAVVGGLLFSQLLTLYITPIVYTYLDELQSWLGRRRLKRRAPADVAAGDQVAVPAEH